MCNGDAFHGRGAQYGTTPVQRNNHKMKVVHLVWIKNNNDNNKQTKEKTKQTPNYLKVFNKASFFLQFTAG